MPINRHTWFDSIPRSDAKTRFWEHFNADKLKGNEIECGDAILAKIPQIEGLISRRKKRNGNIVTTYVELILSRTYDKDKKQSRNKRVIIGIDVSHIYRGMMVINDKYHDYFDKQGNLTWHPEKPEAEDNTAQPRTENALQELVQTNTAVARQFQAETADAEQPQPDTSNSAQAPSPDPDTPFDEQAIHELLNRFKDTVLIQSETQNQTTEGDINLVPKEDEGLEPEEEDDEAIISAMQETQHRRDRLDYLNSLLDHYSTVFDEQAKRKPDNPVTLYQIRRVNALLSEIKEMLSNYENQEYLLLAEEPSPDSDTPPMTSLDMSILLGSYCCTLTAYRLGRLWTTGRPVSEND